MSSDQHRVERLRLWLSEFDGKISSFCRMYGLPRTRASYLSQILSGNRGLGERAARKLEAECNRPNGWLDLGAAEPQQIRYDAARVSQLPAGDRELISGFIEFVLQRAELRKLNSTKGAPMNIDEEFTPHPEQVAAIKKADRKPRQPVNHGTASNTKKQRNAA